ncbi:MAG: hypothetical protein IKW28_03845 [Lachnospiraceae bacterium]|nr:hypothetical protein [Lachnospiraceae bacterium]
MEGSKIEELVEQLKIENEIEKNYLKKQLNMMKFMMVSMAGIFLVLFLAVVILLPKVIETLTSANNAISQISSTMEEIDGIFDSVSSLVEESEQGISMAIDSMNSIDFEGLNQSITDLGNVVSPLAKFFSKF